MFTGMTPESDDWCVDSVPDDVGHWIAGFTCGEGSFLVRETGAAAYRITVRLDDIDTLRLIAETLKLSDFEEAKFIYIYSNQKRRNKGEKAGDEARLAVSNKHIQHTRIISLFERFPVRGKKAMEFEIYKDVIKIACKKDFETPPRPRYNDAEKAFFADAAAKIQGLRKAPMSLK
jgi:formylmethanofuran dehydrogenase subunit E